MDTNNLINITQGIWPTIQPIVQTLIPSTITIPMAGLLFRKKHDEWKKIQIEEMGKVALKMLENGEISPIEFIKFRNISQIAKKADDVFKKGNHEKKSNKAKQRNINVDWFIRFLEAAGNVNDEQMQELWAKILSGEVDNPGDFSLRSIDILKNMNKDEAICFNNISQYIINHKGIPFIYRNEFPLPSNYKVPLDDVIKMSDCGIMSMDINIGIGGTLHNRVKKALLLYAGEYCCVADINKSIEYTINAYRFTNVGKELLRLIDYIPNNNYILNSLRNIKKEQRHFKITIHQLININENVITYDSTEIE